MTFHSGVLLSAGKNVTKRGAENLLVTADRHNWIHTGAALDYGNDAAGNMTYDPLTE